MGTKLLVQPIDVQGADHRTIARIRLQASESGLEVIVESNQPGVLEAIGMPHQRVSWERLDQIHREVNS